MLHRGELTGFKEPEVGATLVRTARRAMRTNNTAAAITMSVVTRMVNQPPGNSPARNSR